MSVIYDELIAELGDPRQDKVDLSYAAVLAQAAQTSMDLDE